MSIPVWWQVTTPHKDIREKNFTESVFAADLGDVLNGNAPNEYIDSRLFFSKTYLTEGLKNLMQNVLSRLSEGRGDPVIQLQTPFGGGKTHSLLCLYHLGKSFNEISHYSHIQELVYDYPDFKGANVAAFAGTTADPISGRTPWGEIAYQLSCYDLVREHDQNRVAPGKERIREMLERSTPCLILIDELLQYIVKSSRMEVLQKITQGQTLSFLQELSEAVSVYNKSALVLALPASVLEQYDQEAEKALAQISKVSGRVESIYVPVEGMEIYEVIRKRLLENYGDLTVHKNVAEHYFRLYQSLGNDAPGEVKDVFYREKIEKAYPFHPELIDILYERWGSFPTFQRTRGVLRLLAMVIGDLYERKVNSPLIQSSLVNLSNQEIRREFLAHIGNEYDSIIASDITGKASRIDKEMGSEYEKYDLAKGLATSVFLYSFSGSERKGITLPWLRTSLLREGIPSTIVGDAVSKLENSLWYFHADKSFYRFKNQPNLNRVIVDKEETIETSQIIEKLKDELETLVRGTSLSVFIWPENASDIPDNKRLKLAVLDVSYPYGYDETKNLVTELAEKSGGSPRVHMNTLFFLVADENAYLNLEHRIRRFIALKAIEDDKDISLTPNDQEDVKTRLNHLKNDIPFQIMHTYRHIGWYGKGEIFWKDMGMPAAGESTTLSGRVFQYLKDEECILSRVTPKLLLDKAFGKEETEKIVQDCYDLFLRTPGLPCMESEEVIFEAVKNGVNNYLLGLKRGNNIYFGETLAEVNPDDVILRPEIAETEKKRQTHEDESQTPANDATIESGGIKQGEQEPSEAKETEGTSVIDTGITVTPDQVKEVSIKANIPWDKLAQLPNGVILPLRNAGATPFISLNISARCEEGFDRTTLDNKVKETLQQIGAEIEAWEED